MNLFLIMFVATISGNIALTYFLGMCPFVSMSKRLDVASGMGFAVTFVMVITATVNYLLNTYILIPLNLEYLQFLVFIVTIAMIVQILEIFIDRYSPSMYASFGLFLPLITVNCSILGVSLLMNLRGYTLLETIFFSFGSGIGWLLAIVTMGALRRRLAFSDHMTILGDTGITAILAGIMAMAFMGFSGVGMT